MKIIPSWVDPNELQCLAELAKEVPENGQIVEIGALYGASTMHLATNAPKATVVTIDEFSWTPSGYPKASAELLLENLSANDVHNVNIIEGDSRVIGKQWTGIIDLLFIDGGHSYEFVKSDLDNFAPTAQVVALHDFDNPFWPTIRKAVEDFLQEHDYFFLDKVVGTVAVLRRK